MNPPSDAPRPIDVSTTNHPTAPSHDAETNVAVPRFPPLALSTTGQDADADINTDRDAIATLTDVINGTSSGRASFLRPRAHSTVPPLLLPTAATDTSTDAAQPATHQRMFAWQSQLQSQSQSQASRQRKIIRGRPRMYHDHEQKEAHQRAGPVPPPLATLSSLTARPVPPASSRSTFSASAAASARSARLARAARSHSRPRARSGSPHRVGMRVRTVEKTKESSAALNAKPTGARWTVDDLMNYVRVSLPRRTTGWWEVNDEVSVDEPRSRIRFITESALEMAQEGMTQGFDEGSESDDEIDTHHVPIPIPIRRHTSRSKRTKPAHQPRPPPPSRYDYSHHRTPASLSDTPATDDTLQHEQASPIADPSFAIPSPILHAPTRAVIDKEPMWMKQLSQCRGLILSMPHRDLGDDGAQVVSRLLRSNPAITQVDVRANGLSSEGCAAILASLSHSGSGVRVLDLSGMVGFAPNELGQAGAYQLKKSFQSSRSNNDNTNTNNNGNSRQTSGGSGCKLNALRLQQVGSVGIYHLVTLQSFEFAKTLRVLDLTANNIGQAAQVATVLEHADGAAAGAGADETTTNKTLLVRNTDKSAPTSPNPMPTRPIDRESKSNTFLTDTDSAWDRNNIHIPQHPPASNPQQRAPSSIDSLFVRLCHCLQSCPSLEKLVLAQNRLDDSPLHIDAFSNLLNHASSKLRCLDLRHNALGITFCTMMGKLFANDQHPLKILQLDYNVQIADQGASEICAGLVCNSSLTLLSMRGCGLSRTAGVWSRWQREIDLSSPLDILSAPKTPSASWIDLLRSNQVLQRLNLSHNAFSTAEIANFIRFGVTESRSLEVLELRHMKLSDEPRALRRRLEMKYAQPYTVSEARAAELAAIRGEEQTMATRRRMVDPDPISLPPEHRPSSLLASVIHCFHHHTQFNNGNPAHLQTLDLRLNELGDSFALGVYKHALLRHTGKSTAIAALKHLKLAYNNIDERYIDLINSALRSNAIRQRHVLLKSLTREWNDIKGCEMQLEKTNETILDTVEEARRTQRGLLDTQRAFEELQRREAEETQALEQELASIQARRSQIELDTSIKLAEIGSKHSRAIQAHLDDQARAQRSIDREQGRWRNLKKQQVTLNEMWKGLQPLHEATLKELHEFEHELSVEIRELFALKRECSVNGFKLVMHAGRILRVYQFLLILYAEQPRAIRASRRARPSLVARHSRVTGIPFHDLHRLLAKLSEKAPQFYQHNISKYFDMDLEDFGVWFYDKYAIQFDADKKVKMMLWVYNLLEHYTRIPGVTRQPTIEAANGWSAHRRRNSSKSKSISTDISNDNDASSPNSSGPPALSMLQPQFLPLLTSHDLASPSAAHSSAGSVAIIPPSIPTSYPLGTYRHFVNLQISYGSVESMAHKRIAVEMIGGIDMLKPVLKKVVNNNVNNEEKNPDEAGDTDAKTSDAHTFPSHTITFLNADRPLSSFDLPIGSTLLLLLKDEARNRPYSKHRIIHTHGTMTDDGESSVQGGAEASEAASIDRAPAPRMVSTAVPTPSQQPSSARSSMSSLKHFHAHSPKSKRSTPVGLSSSLPSPSSGTNVPSQGFDFQSPTSDANHATETEEKNEDGTCECKEQQGTVAAEVVSKPVVRGVYAQYINKPQKLSIDENHPQAASARSNRSSRRSSMRTDASSSTSGALSSRGTRLLSPNRSRRAARSFSPSSRSNTSDSVATSGGVGEVVQDEKGLIRLGGGLVRTVEEDEAIRVANREKLEIRMKKYGQRDATGLAALAASLGGVSSGGSGGSISSAHAINTIFPHLSFHSSDWHEISIDLTWTVSQLVSQLCQLLGGISEHLVLDLKFVPNIKAQYVEPHSLMATALEPYRLAMEREKQRAQQRRGSFAAAPTKRTAAENTARGRAPHPNDMSTLLSGGNEHAANVIRASSPAGSDQRPPSHDNADHNPGLGEIIDNDDDVLDGSIDPLTLFRYVAPSGTTRPRSQPSQAQSTDSPMQRPSSSATSTPPADEVTTNYLPDAALQSLLTDALAKAARMEKARLKRAKKTAAATAKNGGAGGFYSQMRQTGQVDADDEYWMSGRRRRLKAATASAHMPKGEQEGSSPVRMKGKRPQRKVPLPHSIRRKTSDYDFSLVHALRQMQGGGEDGEEAAVEGTSWDENQGQQRATSRDGSRSVSSRPTSRQRTPSSSHGRRPSSQQRASPSPYAGMSLEEIIQATAEIANQVRQEKMNRGANSVRMIASSATSSSRRRASHAGQSRRTVPNYTLGARGQPILNRSPESSDQGEAFTQIDGWDDPALQVDDDEEMEEKYDEDSEDEWEQAQKEWMAEEDSEKGSGSNASPLLLSPCPAPAPASATSLHPLSSHPSSPTCISFDNGFEVGFTIPTRDDLDYRPEACTTHSAKARGKKAKQSKSIESSITNEAKDEDVESNEVAGESGKDASEAGNSSSEPVEAMPMPSDNVDDKQASARDTRTAATRIDIPTDPSPSPDPDASASSIPSPTATTSSSSSDSSPSSSSSPSTPDYLTHHETRWSSSILQQVDVSRLRDKMRRWRMV